MNLVWTLVEVYAPNLEQKAFFSDLINKIEEYHEGSLIIMGHFNLVMNGGWDKSAQSTSYSSMPKKWKNQLKERDVGDI